MQFSKHLSDELASLSPCVMSSKHRGQMLFSCPQPLAMHYLNTPSCPQGDEQGRQLLSLQAQGEVRVNRKTEARAAHLPESTALLISACHY